MDFLGIGPGELILILLIALIVVGPRRLPEVSSALGKALRDLRQASQEMTSELSKELQAPLEELEKEKARLGQELQAPLEELKKDKDRVAQDLRAPLMGEEGKKEAEGKEEKGTEQG